MTISEFEKLIGDLGVPNCISYTIIDFREGMPWLHESVPAFLSYQLDIKALGEMVCIADELQAVMVEVQ